MRTGKGKIVVEMITGGGVDCKGENEGMKKKKKMKRCQEGEKRLNSDQGVNHCSLCLNLLQSTVQEKKNVRVKGSFLLGNFLCLSSNILITPPSAKEKLILYLQPLLMYNLLWQLKTQNLFLNRILFFLF